MQSDLYLGTEYFDNCIGDFKSQIIPNLLSLFNLQTICAKAVYNVILLITVNVSWALAIYEYIYLRVFIPDGRFYIVLQSLVH
jgi:hypothetical protein